MWVQDEDASESDERSDSSSDDEGDIQYEILEKQRDETNQRLSELEEVSNQILKEMNILELQFQIERSCRESAEALALEVCKENKVLKRQSQMLMPGICETQEDVTFDPDLDPVVEGDVVDQGEDKGDEETLPLLENQAKIAELQATVDGLLTEKMQLEQEREDLTNQLGQLREQLALEVEEKEALLRKMNKQNKSMNKIKRVSQLVTEEFEEMSQRLELEEGLRQEAEVLAQQMMEQQKAAHVNSVTLRQSSETELQLQQALEQISNISAALRNIQRFYQERGCGCGEQVKQSQDAESNISELQTLTEQLEKSQVERKALESELTEVNCRVVQLEEEVRQLLERLNNKHSSDEALEKSPAPLLPPPPPPPPPPAPPLPLTTSSPVTNSLDFLRQRRKDGARKRDLKNVDLKANAVEEMMERIKKGIVLRPVKNSEEDDSSWKDQRSENRKSKVQELRGMLDNMKRQHFRRVPSRRGVGRNVGETELLLVLQRRRRVVAGNLEPNISTQIQDSQTDGHCAPAVGDVPWADECGSAPVLRRLKQNREKRDSRIRSSALIVSQEGL
ncbi:shootin-1 isoform X2 [Cynoglossus semilaevis]|uniref:shootin-1 isoform X2 n=1 Tax=Cynoglossus semilaevis TaxID=244447 RepID=UPI0007DCA653|nr:shootin-1-like isoform X2 [Cynoglossus semilaevis]